MDEISGIYIRKLNGTDLKTEFSKVANFTKVGPKEKPKIKIAYESKLFLLIFNGYRNAVCHLSYCITWMTICKGQSEN